MMGGLDPRQERLELWWRFPLERILELIAQPINALRCRERNVPVLRQSVGHIDLGVSATITREFSRSISHNQSGMATDGAWLEANVFFRDGICQS